MLGAQPVRPIDLAGFYAAIANEGKRPTPHVIESITQDGREVYKADEGLRRLATVDPAAVFQLRTFLQGVVARGTAARLSSLSPYIGGKTGTSDDFNDAWFAGFSNDVTIVVWVGYDNAKGKRTLGNGQAGGKVALPIFEPIMKAVWAQRRAADAAAEAVARGGAPSGRAADRRAFRPAARRPRRRHRFDVRGAGGSRVAASAARSWNISGLDDSGRINDTQDRLTSRGSASAATTTTRSPLPVLVRPTDLRSSGFGFSERLPSGPVLRCAGYDGRPGYQPALAIRPLDDRPPIRRADTADRQGF